MTIKTLLIGQQLRCRQNDMEEVLLCDILIPLANEANFQIADLPFVGTEPKEGHSPGCHNRSLGVSPPKAPRGDRGASRVQLPIGPIQIGGMAPAVNRASAPPRAPVGPSRSRQPPLVQNGTRFVEVKAGEKIQIPTVQPQGFTDTQPSLNMLAALGIARHGPMHNESKGGIIMVGSKAMFSEIRKTAEVFDHLIADNSRAVTIREILQVCFSPTLFSFTEGVKNLETLLHKNFQRVLFSPLPLNHLQFILIFQKCTFRYHQTIAGHLLLWATSDHNDATAVDRGQAFLLGVSQAHTVTRLFMNSSTNQIFP